VRIVLDDFGTGYWSLSYLHAFSCDKIMIDRVFIADLERNQYSIAIVRAVIDLGHSLNIPIVAEGAVTTEQHELLFRKRAMTRCSAISSATRVRLRITLS